MTAEMVTENQPAIVVKLAAPPCRECGGEGGNQHGDCTRPWRARGYCSNCYNRHWDRGDFPTQLYATEAEMIWHTTDMVRQPHALRSYAYDPHSVATAAEQRAARWLLDHPEQVQAGLTEATPLFGWGGA